MLDRLIDIAAGVWDQAVPVFILDEDYRGVRLRWGRYKEDLGPGRHWKIPFIDSIRDDQVTARPYNLDVQSLTSYDGKDVMISAVVTVEISSIRKALVGTPEIDEVVGDCCVGSIGDAIRVNDWETITGPDFPEHLRKQCQRSANRFGLKIIRLQIDNLVQARTYRLVQ